jgi:hypothetical protein
MDPGEALASRFGIEAHPTSVVVDARGVVRYVNSGYLKGEEKTIAQEVRKALAAREETGGAP